MHEGKLVFAQIMLYDPLSTFRRCVAEHRGAAEEVLTYRLSQQTEGRG